MNLPNLEKSYPGTLKHKATSTVGRGKVTNLNTNLNFSVWSDEYASLHLGDSLQYYDNWEQPTAIVSDGAYGRRREYFRVEIPAERAVAA